MTILKVQKVDNIINVYDRISKVCCSLLLSITLKYLDSEAKYLINVVFRCQVLHKTRAFFGPHALRGEAIAIHKAFSHVRRLL